MNHFIYSLSKKDSVPGGGNPLEWLNYYKLNQSNGEVYLPFAYDTVAYSGDVLWIMYEQEILARALILRSVPDQMNNREELWYDSSQLHFVSFDLSLFDRLLRIFGREYSTGRLNPKVGESWMKKT